MDLIQSILSANSGPSIHKDTDVHIDVKELSAFEPRPIDVKTTKLEFADFMKRNCTENVQLLLNQLYDLPTESIQDNTVFVLPRSKLKIPREKPVPKPRPPTKWEAFARLKGITKKKKGRMVYDEENKEYRPRWGYKRKGDLKDDWVLEVPQNSDPYEDQFTKKSKEKKERVAKNELQRLRNIAKNVKGKVSVGITPSSKPEKDQLSRALLAARHSDASLGKFSQPLKDEHKKMAKSGKKRKFAPNTGDLNAEKKRMLEILSNKTLSNRPVIDAQKAANKAMDEENRTRKKFQRSGGRRSKQGRKPKTGDVKKMQFDKKGRKKSGKKGKRN